MKKQLFALLAAAALVMPAYSAEDTRTIRLIQDDAQEKLTTKVYNLKNLKASDIAGLVYAAVRRYYAQSTVRSLNFSANKQQSVIVTAPQAFIPYVDQIIEVLDQGTKKNSYGSSVYGSGFRWKVYWPQYRSARALTLPADVMLSNNGNVYAHNGALWVKDDLGDVDYALEWVRAFDRPLPQVKLTFNYYTVRESTLRDIGVDYLAWKNGPGMNLLDLAYNAGHVAWDQVLTNALSTATSVGTNMSWAYGGCFTAPAFDMSFIRLLQQSGEAKVQATATMVMINHQSVSSAALDPVYNNQVKNKDFASSVVPSEIQTDMTVNVYDPVICFLPDKSEISDMGWIPSSQEFYAKNKGTVNFSYDITSTDAVEANNLGAQIGDNFLASSMLKTLDCGHEQLLASAVREHDVEQTTGVPFLCQLPVLKYIFGTTTTMTERTHIFVTVRADLMHPDTVAQAK